MRNLEGKVAIVTGGVGLIGRAITRKLADRGADVAVVDLDGKAAEGAAKALNGGRAIGIDADISSPDSIAALMKRVQERYGRLDIVVNNAGTFCSQPFLGLPLEEWRRVLDVNLTGPFILGQAAARCMIEQGDGGAIVNVTSVAGQRAGYGRTAYGSSKAGLEQLTRQMALELATHGIRANAVAPGPISREDGEVLHKEDEHRAFISALPFRRFGLPDEVANCVVFLSSDESSYVTGRVLNVDGGLAAAGLTMPPVTKPWEPRK
ncbi:SDR family NAD(P)-dependent oxidoreductase [Bradyrhizobium glycinis]|uniref:SDR family NAD(P)-dependent oxidoreductase n=1 Tax=Bradyrhizobium glycinis TaxID=2751812 RepID=UPI0018D9F606|nr:SDR family NAD(P)-dependent oxidoreductase [Bradyrhizobium glycinis]MBH5371580.1 SDR family oxidoreductase [Bradyrhizobium glycinis]